MRNTESEFGVSLSEACKHYCRPDIRERFQRAGDAAGWSIRHVRSRLGGLTEKVKERQIAVAAYKVAESEVKRDIETKLGDGRLVAMGFFAGESGRDPDASRRRIPVDVLKSRGCRIERTTGEISGNRLTYVDVRLGPTYEAPGAAAALVGCSLSKCFQQVVVDDWLRTEMEEPAFRRFPSWKFPPEQFYPFASGRWPVRFEDWSDPAYGVVRFKELIIVLDRPSPIPPEEVVAVRKRIEEQARRLITWLRDGTLVAEGTKEPPDHGLDRVKIPPAWWDRAGVDMDVDNNTLCSGPLGRETLIFSGISVPAPEAAVQKVADIRSRDESLRPKGKPGRPRKWDWPGAERELKRLAKAKGGLPHPQRLVEDYIKNWFLEKYDNHPADSSVRKFVRKHLPSGYHKEN